MPDLHPKPSAAAAAAAGAAPQAITNPRRILAISHESSAELLTALMTDLTGSPPSPSPFTKNEGDVGEEEEKEKEGGNDLAGTTHHLSLKTKYYTASVPIWLDLISDRPDEWASSFLSEDAKEVLDVLGGIVVVFPVAGDDIDDGQRHKKMIEQVGKVIKEGLGGWEWGGVSLAIGVGGTQEDDGAVDEWDDLCAGLGMEFVHWEGMGQKGEGKEKGKRNEYGERVGIERVREALESNDWDSGVGVNDEDEGEEGGGEEDEFDFGVGVGKEEDMEALKRAIFSGGGDGGEGSREKEEEREGDDLDDDDIKSLERMMQKLQAVRDMSAGLPEGERKRMAKRAVEEVMKEL
ncbi:hypothetical protein QBC44DRAFT_354546 [Cladorrhinum sp. PSN332]|nr:hypothetical protein QBC44DRAFT_354546 [Cladorrhinum sp. PSN332]